MILKYPKEHLVSLILNFTFNKPRYVCYIPRLKYKMIDFLRVKHVSFVDFLQFVHEPSACQKQTRLYL